MMRLFAAILLGFSTLVVHAQNKRLFSATLLKPPGSPLPNVFGTATVFLASDDRLAYAGWGQSFPPLLDGGNCTAANTCGVAIHSGTCTAVGDRYFVAPVTDDPWATETYTTDASGDTSYNGIVTTGGVDLEGKIFTMTDDSGTIVACGLLIEQFVQATQSRVFFSSLEPFDGQSVSGSVTLFTNSGQQGMHCMYAAASGLPANIQSVLVGGSDCAADFECGMHIHAGTTCDTPQDAGAPFFATSVPSNPWSSVGYLSTDAGGNAEFVDCVQIGTGLVEGRTFVTHDETGVLVACGVLGVVQGPTPAPVTTMPPSRAPTRGPTTSSPTTETAFPTQSNAPTPETPFPTSEPEPTTDPPDAAFHGALQLWVTVGLALLVGLLVGTD